MTRGINDLLADLAEAADAAAELVMLGKERWDAERPLRLAGEAVVGRLGDIATKLPDDVTEATPGIPWRAADSAGSRRARMVILRGTLLVTKASFSAPSSGSGCSNHGRAAALRKGTPVGHSQYSSDHGAR